MRPLRNPLDIRVPPSDTPATLAGHDGIGVETGCIVNEAAAELVELRGSFRLEARLMREPSPRSAGAY
jgi:hypothetical protein